MRLPRRMLAAALHELARRDGVNLEEHPEREGAAHGPRAGGTDARREGQAARARKAARPSLDKAIDAELFLPMGSKKGLRANDIVGALANGHGIPTSAIGRITIHEHVTFVGLPSNIVDDLVASAPKIELRRHTVPLARARPRGAAAHDATGRPRATPGTRGKAPGRPRLDRTGKMGGNKPPSRRKK